MEFSFRYQIINQTEKILPWFEIIRITRKQHCSQVRIIRETYWGQEPLGKEAEISCVIKFPLFHKQAKGFHSSIKMESS